MSTFEQQENWDQIIAGIQPEIGQWHNNQGMIYEYVEGPIVIQRIYNSPDDEYPAVIHVLDADENLIGVYPSPFQLGIALLAGLVEETDLN